MEKSYKPAMSGFEEARFVLIEDPVPPASTNDMPPTAATADAGRPFPPTFPTAQSPDLPDAAATAAPRPSTGSSAIQTPSPAPQSLTPSSAAMPPGKKKPATSISNKPTKRPRNSGAGAKAKRPKSKTLTASAPGSTGEESDNGPYCICRGPDDHRWMICCEACEDWFHGECIKMPKDIGESLIERFICPNCTTEKRATVYRKSCSFNNCRKPARLTEGASSTFCSDEHAQLWWERMISKLPKFHGKGVPDTQFTQSELMAVLKHGASGGDAHDSYKLFKAPFSGALPGEDGQNGSDDALSKILSDEEKRILDDAAKTRSKLMEETRLCNDMLRLVENAQERRRAAIAAGRFTDDMCGYDSRLDTVLARDAFAAFMDSPEGKAALALCDATKEDDVSLEGMCDRKRCKGHGGWQKMLPLSIKHQVRVNDKQAVAVAAEEQVVRNAAVQRWKRKQTEKNWVQVPSGE